MPGTIAQQIFWLIILPIPVACIARTVVFEEIFREPREYCQNRCKNGKTLLARKFFYLFTCEYCFSHYVAIVFLAMTGFKLLMDDWRGYIVSFFTTVLVANFYMNLYARLRVDITQAKTETKILERQAQQDGLPGEHAQSI